MFRCHHSYQVAFHYFFWYVTHFLCAFEYRWVQDPYVHVKCLTATYIRYKKCTSNSGLKACIYFLYMPFPHGLHMDVHVLVLAFIIEICCTPGFGYRGRYTYVQKKKKTDLEYVRFKCLWAKLTFPKYMKLSWAPHYTFLHLYNKAQKRKKIQIVCHCICVH